MKPLKIFIGFDPKEAIAFYTLIDSIHRQSSIPVSITPLNIANLNSVYHRVHDQRQSNSFSFTRFLVPYLCQYEGWALFMDCDMLLRCDIAELLSLQEEHYAVRVVKHDYESKVKTKYLGNQQYSYPRKNWSSFVLWNCAHRSNRLIDLDFVKDQDAATLHRFLWLKDDEIGELDTTWNWLVGEYENPPRDVKNVHWTLGGPYFNEYKNVEFSHQWFEQNKKVNYCAQIDGSDK